MFASSEKAILGSGFFGGQGGEMLKRLWLVCLTTALVLGLLAGCAGRSEDSSSDSGNGDDTTIGDTVVSDGDDDSAAGDSSVADESGGEDAGDAAADGSSEDAGGEDSLDDLGEGDATETACALTGLWDAVFSGTDWGNTHVQFSQTDATYTGVGDGVDTDEGPLTIRLSGDVDGSEFSGPYTSDYHWNPGETDFIGEIDGTCYGDVISGEWRSCVASTAVEGECPVFEFRGRFRGTRRGETTVNTAGCEAAVVAMCEAAGECSDDFPLVPDIDALEDCDQTIEDNSERVDTACSEFLTQGIENGEPMALYLNSADSAHIESCVTGQNCDREFLIATAAAAADFLESGDTSDLTALLAPLVASCYLE